MKLPYIAYVVKCRITTDPVESPRVFVSPRESIATKISLHLSRLNFFFFYYYYLNLIINHPIFPSLKLFPPAFIN